MILTEILKEDCCSEVIYVDSDDVILSEAAIRQFKRVGQKIVKKYRCLAGPKKGKLVSSPSSCSQRKDPKKVRQGRKVMRTKKGVIARKSRVAKRQAMSKVVANMNKRLMGEGTVQSLSFSQFIKLGTANESQ